MPNVDRLDGGLHAASFDTMRLIDTLAARRALYPRPLATCPDVMVLDVPAKHASSDLPLGRYYPIIIETDDEHKELSDFLTRNRPALIPPDLLDHRPSALIAHDVALCRYDAPGIGWPWLLLCHWPPLFTQMVAPGGDDFARGAYTTELFTTAAELEAMQLRLVEQLNSQHAFNIRFVSNESFGTA